MSTRTVPIDNGGKPGDSIGKRRTPRLWERQVVRAGPLVKELRMQRPRGAPGDSPEDRREKNWIRRRCALNRGMTDALELRLALLGWDAVHYVLTFDRDHLPEKYRGVELAFRSFLRRVRRDREKRGLSPGLDYVRCIEGLHGDHRYHIHFVCRAADLPEDDVRRLWSAGDVSRPEPVLLDWKGYRRLALYLTKERRDGKIKPLDKKPLTWSASLKAPEARCSAVKSGTVRPPAGALCVRRPAAYRSEYGAFQYGAWLVPDGTAVCHAAEKRLI